MKTCRDCGEAKPRSDFYREAKAADGLRGYCKQCFIRRSVERHRANPDSPKAATKRWREKNPDKVAGQRQRYYDKHRENLAAKAAAYREANPVTFYAAIRRWKLANPDRVKELEAASRERRRESIRVYNAAYRAANPEKKRAEQQRRRARKLGQDNAAYCTAERIEARVAFYAGRCRYCGTVADTMDHRIPLARGGAHLPANLVPACRSCNSRKHTQTESEFSRSS